MAVGKVAAGKCGVVHDVYKNATNCVTRETAFLLECLRVAFFGYDVFYLNLCAQSYSVK